MLTLGKHFLFNDKVIAYGVLDWGMGHATRSAAIIRGLLANNRVIICCAGEQRAFFTSEFPGVPIIELASHHIRYSKVLPAWLKVVMSSVRIYCVTMKDRESARMIDRSHAPDIFISDNRYGFFLPGTHSVLVTHQLRILSPLFPRFANALLRGFVKRFSQVWVPDYPDLPERISGLLSVPALSFATPIRYIGPKSNLAKSAAPAGNIDLLVILSGPEPQRGLLEARLLKALGKIQGRVVMVRGTMQGNVPASSPEMIGLADRDTLTRLIASSAAVLCRSGYSTLMDLHFTGFRKLILVPTPGQPEQVYLAKHWQENFGAYVIPQKEIRTGSPALNSALGVSKSKSARSV